MSDAAVVEGEDGKPAIVAAAIECLHEFQPLHEWESGGVKGKLTARIIRIRHRTFLDLREHQEGPEFTGYTKRGLRLSAHEIHILEAYIFPTAKQLLRGRRAPVPGEAQPCNQSTVTDAREVTPIAS